MESKTVDLSGPICRACLKLGAKNNIFSTHNATSLSYSYIFSSCISLQVNSEDGLPKLICQKCLNTLLSFYVFKTKVVQNDLMLRQILKIEKIDSYDSLLENGDVSKQPASSNLSHNVIKENEFINKIQDLKINNKSEPFEQRLLENGNIKIQECLDSEKSEDFKDEDKNVTNNKKKTHQCDVCGKIVNSKSNLNQHYRKHTGERPYACDECGKKFLRAEHLVIHTRTHTGERPHHCTICPKSFKQNGGLRAHMRVHSGECPFVCCVCGKSFNHSSSLRYHKQTHSNETPHTCKTCKKSFKNAGYLKIHMRFHDDKRPFSCKMCDKKFFTSSHLNVHVKRHNNIVSHKCIVCGKGFVRSQHLKIHLATHTGEKAHACKMCPKKFTQPSHLNRHMKIHRRT